MTKNNNNSLAVGVSNHNSFTVVELLIDTMT